MNPITSIYIHRIDSNFTAEFIAHVLDRNNIAQLSRVLIEPYKSNIKNGLKYNRAYIGIKSWYETESAYNFIKCLRNPTREARIVYCEDNWWAVDINKYHSKLASNKCVLTVFGENEADFSDDELISTAVVVKDELEEFIKVDVEKTKLLRNIIANLKNKSNDKISTTAVVGKDELEEFIILDVEKTKLLRNIIANLKNKSNDKDVATFDSYVHE